jgi:hypothetical protein
MAGRRARHAAVWLVAVVVQVGRVQAEDGPSPPPPCTLSCGSHGSPSSDYKPCHCNCRSGWSGSTCDHATGCDDSPNCGHGTCVADGGSHTCRCSSGWRGNTCRNPTGCDDSPNCGHGSCVANGGSHTCECSECYRGVTCGTPTGCDQANCHHGTCSVPSGDPCGHTCACSKGYSGADCNHDPCEGVDCHHGSCDRNDNGRGYTCSCNVGWTGSDCTSCKAAYTCPNKVPVAHSSSSCSDGSDESTCYRGPSCRATCDSCYNGDPSDSERFSCGTDSTATSAWDGSLT